MVKSSSCWLQMDQGDIYCPFIYSVYKQNNTKTERVLPKQIPLKTIFKAGLLKTGSCDSVLVSIEHQISMNSSSIRKEQTLGLIQERWENVQLMLSVVKAQPWCDLTSYMFGYVLAHLDVKRQTKLIGDLRPQFDSMKEQYSIYNQLKAEDVVMIVCDLVYEVKKRGREGQSSETRAQQALLAVMYRNLAGTLQNKRYIFQKWEKEVELENNQRLMIKMLEEEEMEMKRKAKEKEKEGWECQICLCEIDPSFMGILECGHIFHPQCLNGFLKAQIQSSNIEIRCPMETCKVEMTPGDIHQFIDGDLHQKYEKYSFNKYVEGNAGNVSWCPTAGCTGVFEFDAALDNYRCPACKKHYCLRCRCEYHHGMSCAQYRVSHSFDKNDEKFIDFVKGAKFKQCPKCKYWVERKEGCSTMTCKCGQQFCYDCGGTGCPHGRCSNSGGLKGILNMFIK